MKALVLSGGGARGAYEAGVVSVLASTGSYDVVCGTSIGAINAAFVAAGQAQALKRFWCEVLPARVARLLPHVPRMRHLLADMGELGKGSRWNDLRLLAHALSDMRFLDVFTYLRSTGNARIAELAGELQQRLDLASVHCGLVVGATNVTLGAPVAFYARCSDPASAAPPHRAARASAIEWRALERERFAWALLSSAALPGLMAPIELEFDGQPYRYADGGLVHNSPLGLAIDAGATDITVVFVDPATLGAAMCPEHSLGRMACAMFVLWQQRALEYELRLVEATNALARLGAAPEHRMIQLRHVRPPYPLTLDVLGFDDAAAISEAFEQGARDAEQIRLM